MSIFTLQRTILWSLSTLTWLRTSMFFGFVRQDIVNFIEIFEIGAMLSPSFIEFLFEVSSFYI